MPSRHWRLVVALLFALPPFAGQLPAAEDRAIFAGNIDVGEEGALASGNLTVVEIIDKKTMVLRWQDYHPFILEGKATAGLAAGKTIAPIEGTWKVTGTRKRGGRTLCVLVPGKEKPKPRYTPAQLWKDFTKVEGRKIVRLEGVATVRRDGDEVRIVWRTGRRSLVARLPLAKAGVLKDAGKKAATWRVTVEARVNRLGVNQLWLHEAELYKAERQR